MESVALSGTPRERKLALNFGQGQGTDIGQNGANSALRYSGYRVS
jgi:hypothetical protein